MNQSRSRARLVIFQVFFVAFSLFFFSACDHPAPAPVGPAKIASLVPAATDLLLAMHLNDRLVAVSNYDRDPGVKSLPRVGDYQQIDWEKLASLHASIMIVQMAPDHMPPGLVQRADSLGMKLINVQIENIADIYTAAAQLADAAGAHAAGDTLIAAMKHDLDAVQDRVKNQPRVKALLVVDADPKYLAGRGTFLDDLLTIAGGENAAPATLPHWPAVDRETLSSLSPQAILQLLPDASSQVLAQAKQNAASLSDLPAVKDGKVYPVTDSFILQPGSHITDVAKLFADKLHPSP